jgi:hypothetical protein
MDTIDIHLAFSRDGRTWWRSPERRPFLVNGTRGSYDAGMIFVSQHPIVRKDLGEIWIYYVGAEKGHWAVNRGENQQSSICLAKIRLDGFVSLTAGKTATATTKPIILDGNQLILNAATAGREGEMGVEIIDVETGEPIPGFTLNDCDRFHGDDVGHVVTWNGNDNIGSLTNKPIKLCFELKRAKLFSFQCV